MITPDEYRTLDVADIADRRDYLQTVTLKSAVALLLKWMHERSQLRKQYAGLFARHRDAVAERDELAEECRLLREQLRLALERANDRGPRPAPFTF